MPEAGSPAPDATFTIPDGTPKRVSDLRGQKLVLYFYPKDDTSGCTREAQDFTSMIAEFALAGTAVIGVSRDSEKSHAKFISKYDLKVGLGSDTDGSVTEAFGVWIEKSMYGRKYMGIERATFLIDETGTIARVWRKVKVPGHVAEVLEAARGL
jgi:thioredoxin-dependent peroxiredoxin